MKRPADDEDDRVPLGPHEIRALCELRRLCIETSKGEPATLRPMLVERLRRVLEKIGVPLSFKNADVRYRADVASRKKAQRTRKQEGLA